MQTSGGMNRHPSTETVSDETLSETVGGSTGGPDGSRLLQSGWSSFNPTTGRN